MKWFFVCAALASPAAADPFALVSGGSSLFADQPQVVSFQAGEFPCGMGANSNPMIGFCATRRVIYYREDFASRPQAAYELAHVLGHYAQVQYGVADVALREIRNRRDEEDALRGMVTRQVECLAGVMMAHAGLPFVSLDQLYQAEPFTDAHWGRDPLNVGPQVSIGLAARAEWFETGYMANDVAACSVGEMSADLLVEALR